MNAVSDELEKMRRVANSDRPDECAHLVESLLGQMNTRDISRLIVKQLKDQLPAFEALHSTIHWPRLYLKVIDSFRLGELSNPELRIYSEEEITDERGVPIPSSQAFLEAIGLLHSFLVSQGPEDTKQDVHLAASALNHAIASRMWSRWSEDNLVGYQRWIDFYRMSLEWSEPYDEDQIVKSSEMMQLSRNDPTRKLITHELYLQVADQMWSLLSISLPEAPEES